MSKLFFAIFIMALVTYLPRAIPLLLMKGKIKSKYIQSFLYYIPYAVLAAMTFPAIFYATGNTVSGIIGMIVAVTLAYFNRTLLQVSVIAVVVVYIANGFL